MLVPVMAATKGSVINICVMPKRTISAVASHQEWEKNMRTTAYAIAIFIFGSASLWTLWDVALMLDL